MKTQLYNLLDDVWQALERVGLTGRNDAGNDLGRITCISIVDSQLRILLRIPTHLCRDGGRLLAEVEEALHETVSLVGVEVRAKPYRPSVSMLPIDVFRGDGGTAGRHTPCVSAALAEQCRRGWAIETIEQRSADSPAAIEGEEFATTRVSIRARVDTSGASIPDTPRGSA